MTTSDDKLCFLIEKPQKHLNDHEWWELHYAPHPSDEAWFYTSVTEQTCPDIQKLNKGDRIAVTTLNQKVVKVEAAPFLPC